MSAILVTVKSKGSKADIKIQEFDTCPEARVEMENQWCKASYDGEIQEAEILDDSAWVEDGKDLFDYNWKISWI